MGTLNKTYRLRISNDDLILLKSLKKYKMKPTTFIREAFREKLTKDLPELLKKEIERKEKEYCPF